MAQRYLLDPHAGRWGTILLALFIAAAWLIGSVDPETRGDTPTTTHIIQP